MSNWSLIPELNALLLILLLAVCQKQRKVAPTRQHGMYELCLAVAGILILWNCLCVLLLDHPAYVPRWLLVFTNSVYFWLSVFACTVAIHYLFERMLVHVYDSSCIRRARRVLIALLAAYTLLVILNVRSGWLFFIDENGLYHRGSLNAIGYAFLLAELMVLLCCFFLHRGSVSRPFKRMLFTELPILAVLVLVQLLDRSLLLNGTIIAYLNLTLFLNFQNASFERDDITGLGNRDGFFSELRLQIGGRQSFQIMVICLLDIGNVNRKRGHRRSNEFIYAIGDWLQNQLPEAQLFRFAGSTFAAVLPYSDDETARRNLDTVCARFDKKWTVDTDTEFLRYYACDFICKDGQWQPDRILDIMDYMLSKAGTAPHSHEHFEEHIIAEYFRYREITELLRTAIEARSFEVWYQPIRDMHTGRFRTAEALLRLRSKNGIYISPGEFVPIAEEHGLIGEIFWILLDKVCLLLRELPRETLESVSINLSIQQFGEENLGQRITETLHRHGVEPDRLRWEITERLVSCNIAQAGQQAMNMACSGFVFYLDDFGTGYSNFAFTLQYPFELIKLDRSLVGRIHTSETNRTLVGSLVQLFHDLGMEVLAEGVETQQQLQSLTELGADRIQGYYYARPMPGDELQDFLSRHN